MVPIGKKRPASGESGPGPSCITLRPRPEERGVPSEERGVPSGLFLKYLSQRGSYSLLMTPEAPRGGGIWNGRIVDGAEDVDKCLSELREAPLHDPNRGGAGPLHPARGAQYPCARGAPWGPELLLPTVEPRFVEDLGS
jgi:hypothetical protein